MTAQDLKNSILQLAIQGKLVEQREEEGTAEELFKQIQEEKQKLIKEKKIKKSKQLAEIGEDERLFDIPDSWKWVKLGEIISFKMGKTPPRSELQYWGENYSWISIADMIPNGHITFTKEKISEIALKEKFSTELIPKGTLLMSFKLTVGRVSILDIEAVHNEAIISIFPFVNKYNIFRNYLFITLPLLTSFGEKKDAIKGKTLNKTSINNLQVPLPPLQEQKRIVEKIEVLMPYIDKYDKVYKELTKLNNSFPTDIEKSILQYAIQGKLVEQKEEDGTAEELYKQIQEEKQRLIKEKKIKKAKPLPEIKDEEIPFDIPDSWKWVRLGNLCNYGNNNSISSTNIPEEGWVLDLEDIEKDTAKIVNKKRKKETKCVSSKHIFKKDNILYSKLRPYLNKVIIADENGYSTSEILALDFGGKIYNGYAQKVLMSPYFITYATNCSYGVKMPRLGTKDGQIALFPLPPYSEQFRIVEKIEELMKYTKKFK